MKRKLVKYKQRAINTNKINYIWVFKKKRTFKSDQAATAAKTNDIFIYFSDLI